MGTKRSKASKRSRASKPDRISSLPDDILCHILSFLYTKESVRSRVLSTRWKYLFASVPVLDFQYHTLAREASIVPIFLDFVNSIWILYDVSRMRKFRFFLSNIWAHPPNPCLIASWILAAIRRHVQEIDFTIDKTLENLTLPRDLFSCKTLSVLRVEGSFDISLPNTVCLPCLRTCCFVSVCFSDDSAKRLFRSLPALETLEVRQYYVEEDVEVFNIDAPNLKRLTIYSFGQCQIELNVPNLIYFEYTGLAADDFTGLESLKSVVDASIDYRPESGSIDDVITELLRSLCHVRILTLSSGVIEAFVHSGRSLPTFNNLTRLMFGSISSLASKLLQELLNNSPRLEFFAFNQWPLDEQDELSIDYDQNNYSLPEHVPTCVSLHLKEVECPFFTGLDYDRELLKYLWKNAKNLKDMKIESSFSYSDIGVICRPGHQILLDSDDIYKLRWKSS